MKKTGIFFTMAFISLFSPLTCLFAQNIVGKWKFSQETLRLMFPLSCRMHGYINFKKDSTFIVRINSDKPYKTILVKVKGRYSIKGRKFQTEIQPKGFKTFVSTGIMPPESVGWHGEWRPDSERFENWEEHYYVAERKSYLYESMLKQRFPMMFTWRNVPFTVTSDSLIVGKTAKMKLYR